MSIKRVPTIIFSSLLYALITSCSKEPPLPPPATGEGSDSSHIKSSSNIARATISPYSNWEFGKKAYLHTKSILDFGPRTIESRGHENTQAYITSQLEKYGWVVSRQRFKSQTPYGERSFTNLIARRKDSATSPETVLAAHYDSKMIDGFLGADDAASCVAALLEIAEYLPSQKDGIAAKVELVFFDGEEALTPNMVYLKDGLYGSIYYSQYMRNDVAGPKVTYQKTPKFGILLDMIGHKNLSIKIPSDTPYQLLKSYYAVIEKHGLATRFGVASGPILDDHVPMHKIADLPTIDLIGNFTAKSWWHTQHDNLKNISEDSLHISIQVALEIMRAELARE